MKESLHKSTKGVTIIKKCHLCGHISQSHKEISKCTKCKKSFLPLNYFDKVHDKENQYDDLFAEAHQVYEEDLIKGIYVLW